jgi:DNA-binding SARP family transcriptional activator
MNKVDKTNPANTPDSPKPPWRFYLFGGLRIHYAGEEVMAPPYRTHNLLAYLLLNPKRTSRVYLVGNLFPDVPEDKGRRRLSDHLWLLQRSLPDLPLESSREDMYLPPETRWLDVDAYRDAEGRGELSGYLEALALYQDDLLPEVYADWLLLARENLHLNRIRLLHRTAAILLDQGDNQDALPYVQQLVGMEPLDEGAVRTLMRVYAVLGQRGAALAAYEGYVSLVADELGIVPDAATRALAEALYSARLPEVALPTPEDATPETVLHRARQDLANADRTRLDQHLERLSADPVLSKSLGVRLLAVDYALEFEELDRAEAGIRGLDDSLIEVQIRLAKLALAREKSVEAQEMASKVLLQAHESGDQAVEVEALVVLTQAQRKLGDMVSAQMSAEKAINLGRRLERWQLMVSAQLSQGWIYIRQGRYQEALVVLQQARSQAHEYNLRGELARVTYGISLAQTYQGAFLKARGTLQEALEIWRDLGMMAKEVQVLHRLAHIFGQLGENEEAIRALERAQRICEQTGDRLSAALNMYNLAAAIPYHDETQVSRAITIARQALDLFREYDQSGWVAACLETLGYNLWVAGQYREALGVLEEAYDLHDELGEVGVLPELLAYQGLALLGLGHLEKALECTRQALLLLARSPVDNDIVSEIYYAHAEVLKAHQDEEQANAYFRRAYQNLLKFAAQLEEEDAREAFFQRDPTTRRLMKAVYARGIVPHPRKGVVQRWVRSQVGQPVRVRLTLDAGPSDVALGRSKGAVGLRRVRLGRILREAQRQGAAPTIRELAETLGVSSRTIKRDLAALRDTDSL